MRGSWKIGRFAGVDTHVHWTFLLLVAWAAWASYAGVGTGLAAVLGVVFLFAVFGSVLLHELGHALVARVYGVRTRGIVLTPLGGIAQLEGMPRSPRAELHIALAGPVVNLVLAAGLALVGATTGLALAGLVDALMVANLTLALFNLIPAFPMDGGRVLRAVLAMRVGSRRATDIAVGVGKIAAVGFAIAGLFGNPMLLAIAVFVWLAGSAEARTSRSFDTPWLDDVAVDPTRERYAAPWSEWSRPPVRRSARPVFVVLDPRVRW